MAQKVHPINEAAAAGVLVLDRGVDLTSPSIRAQVRKSLEAGDVVLLSSRGFELTEREQRIVTDPEVMFRGREERNRRSGRPTLTFDVDSSRLLFNTIRAPEKAEIAAMLERYAKWSRQLLAELAPDFAAAAEQNRIIYRPVAREQVQGLHVDSSYFFPTQGRSKLRIFCNIDPQGRPRVWQVGERFEHFAHRYLPRAPGRRNWFRKVAGRLAGMVGLVKGSHTDYDYMLADIRDMGKRDRDYQKTAPRRIVDFPPGSAWVALTDVVLHGGVSGQHSIDQVFFLPVEAFADPSRSAVKILERLSRQALI